MRRLPVAVTGDSYLAADAEAGLLDLHLLPASEVTRDAVLALTAIAHPTLARLQDVGLADGEIYLAEDHIEGVALEDLVRHGGLPGSMVLHLAAALSSCLAEAEQLVRGQPQLMLRIPRLAEIFVSTVGQIKMGLTTVITLPSSADTVIDAQEAQAAAQAAGRAYRPRSGISPGQSPLQGIGDLIEGLLPPPQREEDPATRAARDLRELLRRERGAPGDCRVLHSLAVTALRETATTETGAFVSGQLSDLVERHAPLCAAEEAELAAAAALLLSALPETTPRAAMVQSFCYGAPMAAVSGRAVSRPHVQPAGAHVLGQNLQGTPYKLIRKLGVGGMGIVFEAEHMDLNRRVALKVLHGALNRDPQVLARFKQEARSAARIRHPHIVEIYDFGTTSAGEVFLVMEVLEGQSLHKLCRSGALSLRRSVDILRQVCAGVEAAHQAGVIHRDLKPDNVMVLPRPQPTEDGSLDLIKVLDFGIAKLREPALPGQEPRQAITRQGQLFGTPEYMAPEQILGGKTDHRVDIYALGCIAYEVLSGELPFVGDSYGKMLAAHLKEPPPPLHLRTPDRRIPPLLSDVVLRAMAKDPERRFTTMAEFGSALEMALESLLLAPSSGPGPVTASEVEPQVLYPSGASGPVPPRRVSRTRPILWGTCGAVLGLCGLFLWIAEQPEPAHPHRPPPRAPDPGAATRYSRAPTSLDPPPLPAAEGRVPAPAEEPAGRSVLAAPGEPTMSWPSSVEPAPLPAKPAAPVKARALVAARPAPPAPLVSPPAVAVLTLPRPAAPVKAEPAERPPEPSEAPEPKEKPRPVPAPAAAEGRVPEASKAPPMAPAAAAPAPAVPAPAAPAPAVPAPAAPEPVFTGGKLSYTVQATTSAYGRRDAQSGLDSRRRELEACYQQAVRAAPRNPPRGSGTFTFFINEDGSLVAGRTQSEGAVAGLGPCLEQALLPVRFPRPEIGPAQVTLRVLLEPVP